MSIIASNVLAGASGQAAGGYQIERSLRLNSADSAYLSRTFSAPTTQGTFTFAAWIKRAALGTTQHLFGVSTNHSFGFTSGNALNLTFAGSSALTTTALFRDPSAWYHIVWTQSGTSHKLYVNNVSVGTATATSSVFNTAIAHQIGAANTANYFNGYLADIHFIDGQALTPSSFTEVSATTGQLVPIEYTGTYGTNGFHLDFSDNSAATAATLGADTSGNGNNWTPNNLSVTAGSGNDSLVDTPTSYGTDTGAGGEVRGNYATLNTTLPYTNVTLSNGNLDVTGTATYRTVAGTIGVSSGKWYWEVIAGSADVSLDFHVGIGNNIFNSYIGTWAGSTANGWIYSGYQGNKFNNNSGAAYGAAFTSGDIIGVALDADNGTLTFYKNGVSQGQAYSGLTNGPYFPIITVGNSNTGVINFGQRPFAYAAPSGFKALCDTNLPAPVVAKPNEVMDVALWTGNGSARSITGLGFSPDFVWIKGRSGATDHALYDAVRGVQLDLVSNSDAAETTQTQGLTAFNSDGFSLGTLAKVNTSSATYAGWAWDAGTSTVTNTQGSISSQVRANASAGFSVVTYTGTGSSATVGHGCGTAPKFFIIKRRNTASSWIAWHTGIGSTDILRLESTNAKQTVAGFWQGTNPSSTILYLDADGTVNANGGTYVAYCFAPVAGYSSFGSYVGNGSADGPFVYTGHRSRWILLKRTDAVTDWWIYDTARDTYNVMGAILYPNLSAAEFADATVFGRDLLSNGFKVRTSNATVNGNGATYIYASFAEFPFQYARAR